MSEKAKSKSSKGFYIVCIAVTAVIILALVCVSLYQRSEVAPVYVLTVDGLSADNPADAQALCRSEHERFSESAMAQDADIWVWCGEDELYLVKSDALTVLSGGDFPGFTAVSFLDEKGASHSGYIIDPTAEPKELGRIELGDAEEYTFDSVSMSIRVALRSGDISFENAVYLWEKDSSRVFAVGEDSYTPIEGNLVSFTDDGGTAHVCYILDTKLD